MKRNVYVGGHLCGVVLGVLGFGSACSQKQSRCRSRRGHRRRASKSTRSGRSRCPNHWILGQTIGVSVDAQDHVWIIHRAGSLEPGRSARDHESADRPVLRTGPAVLSSIRRAICSSMGRARRAGLRLAGVEPRRHGRLQRQRLDRRERRAARRPAAQAPGPADSCAGGQPAAGRGPNSQTKARPLGGYFNDTWS